MILNQEKHSSSPFDAKLDIWDFASMAWTEIGLDESQYPQYAEAIKEYYPNWEDVEKIIIKDVCASFAIETSALILLVIGAPAILFITKAFPEYDWIVIILGVISPLAWLFFITPMPDWGYSEEYLKEKIEKWDSKNRWVHFMNPLRVIGYPFAILNTRKNRKKLKLYF